MQEIKDLLEGGKNEQHWFVTAARAEGLNKEMFGGSDPYCKIKFGHKSHETKHIKHEINPIWDETFEFNTNAEEMEITVKDHNLVKDDMIGSCKIYGNEFPSNQGEERRIQKQIEKDGQITGLVELKIQKQ